MSFIHIPSARKKQPKRARSVTARRNQWDDSTSDLTVHKATPEDLKLRKLLSTSKNLDVVRQELDERRLSAARQQILSSSTGCSRPRYMSRSSSTSATSAVARELLYDNEQYRSLLSKTDEALTIARDVLGDDGKRVQVYPAVTPAPCCDDRSERPDGTILSHPAPPTKLEMLNSSVMQQTALNDTSAYVEDDGLQEDVPQEAADSLADVTNEDNVTTSKGSHAIHDNSVAGNRSRALKVGEPASSDRAKSSKQTYRAHKALQSASLTSADMELMLRNLEKEVADLSAQTGTRPAAQLLRTNTFAGYTATLVNANSELAYCLKQVSTKLHEEVTARERLEVEVVSQRKLIDGLTEDLLDVQEKLSRALSELCDCREQTAATAMRLEQALAVGSMTSAAQACGEVGNRDATVSGDEHGPEVDCRPADLPYSTLHLSPVLPLAPAGMRQPATLSPKHVASGSVRSYDDRAGWPPARATTSVDLPRQVLRAWPSDTGNRDVQGPNSDGALKTSMTALQRQIDLLNKEHTQAVSRFRQLQQLQENLTDTKTSAV